MLFRSISQTTDLDDEDQRDGNTSEVSEAESERLLRSVGGAIEPTILGTKTISPSTIPKLLGIGIDDNAEDLTTDSSTSTWNPKGPRETSDEAPAETDDDSVEPTFLVTKVVDGDTVELEGGERVRYIGIDTPESTTEHECYGEEAKAKNRALVEGKRVRLVADAEDRDKYGRLLRYVFLDETFINLTLASEGYATQLTIPPNVAHADEFRSAVANAREQGSGLWSGCSVGEQNESSGSTRTDYDETIPQADTTDCPANQPIKGNAQSMIYHVPGGDFYQKTKPEQCFASEADAVSAGYRKSKR